MKKNKMISKLLSENHEKTLAIAGLYEELTRGTGVVRDLRSQLAAEKLKNENLLSEFVAYKAKECNCFHGRGQERADTAST